MKRNFFLLLFVVFTLVLIGCDSKAVERPVPDPMIGKTVTLRSALLIMADSTASSSATARKINQIGEDLGSIIGCAGCRHESERLTKLLIKGQQMIITDAYEHAPGITEFDSSTVRYFIAKAEGLVFVVPAYALEGAMTGNGVGDLQKVNQYDKLLESFSNGEDMKDFYINVKEHMRPALFPNDTPPYSKQLIEQHYKVILGGLTSYGGSRGEFDPTLFGFPVTVNQRALAFIILNSADLYIDISTYQKL